MLPVGSYSSCAASKWPVGHHCGAAPARVEEAQGAKVVGVKSETQKGTSSSQAPGSLPRRYHSNEAAPGSVHWACIACCALNHPIHTSLLPKAPRHTTLRFRLTAPIIPTRPFHISLLSCKVSGSARPSLTISSIGGPFHVPCLAALQIARVG
jgi:hypothetical protein